MLKLTHYVLQYPADDTTGGSGGGNDTAVSADELSNGNDTQSGNAADSVTGDDTAGGANEGDTLAGGDDTIADPTGGVKKSGLDKRFHDLTQRAKDAEERERLALEALKALGKPTPVIEDRKPADDPKPQAPEFTSPEQYQQDMVKFAEDLAAWTARKTVTSAFAERAAGETKAAQERQAAAMRTAHQERRAAAIAEVPDYVEVAEDPTLPITDATAMVLAADAVGPHIAVWLGRNRAEAERISKLAPYEQVMELGVIRQKVIAERAAKKVTQVTQKPIKPQGGNNGAVSKTIVDVGNDTSPGAMDAYAEKRQETIRASKRRPGAPS